jgi:dGTPase
MAEEIAPYAVTEKNTRGRNFNTPGHSYRSPFQRDRDRIIHSEAFRRLEGKTQVFTPGINDNYRNRLTHSIEVAQIGRTIAGALKLNASLTEAVCLAHDLGHTPFGHSGEEALNKVMAEYGGFEHNVQSLRIVELLEHPYPDFFGLNLMYETRLGLARHSSPYDSPKESTFPEKNSSLEGQIANVADRIAYNCHDLEDGIRSGLINEEQLQSLEIFTKAQKNIKASSIVEPKVRMTRSAKAIIDLLVNDTIFASLDTIIESGIESLQDVYNHDGTLMVFNIEADKQLKELEKFLLENMYLSKQISQFADKVYGWLKTLFDMYCEKPGLMTEFYQQLVPTDGLERTVCDYISGMTDRYCLSILDES